MKMIRQIKDIAVCLILGITLTACSDGDSPEQQFSPEKYITFGLPQISWEGGIGGFTSAPTRAALMTSLDKFYVWGFRRPLTPTGVADETGASKSWNEKSIFFTQGPDIFSNVEVTVNAGFTTYKNGNLSPWSDNTGSSYSFIAGVSAIEDGSAGGTFAMENAVATTGSAHGPRLTFTLNASGSSLGDPLDYKAQPDALIATRFDRKNADGTVPLSFSHFMTGIRFKFHNHTSDKNLVIKRVTFAGKFFKKAVFDFTSDTPVMSVEADNTYSGIFTLLNAEQTITHGSADYMGGDSPVTLLLLPNPDGTLEDDQEYTLGSDKEIKIVYTIGDDGVERTFTHSRFLLNYIPKPNTLHTAHFNFVGDEFVVMFQADNDLNWEDGTNPGADNNIDIH